MYPSCVPPPAANCSSTLANVDHPFAFKTADPAVRTLINGASVTDADPVEEGSGATNVSCGFGTIDAGRTAVSRADVEDCSIASVNSVAVRSSWRHAVSAKPPNKTNVMILTGFPRYQRAPAIPWVSGGAFVSNPNRDRRAATRC